MPSMLRFLAVAIPLAAVTVGAVEAAAAALGWGPDLSPLAARGIGRAQPLGMPLVVTGALFEATALVALYLLIARGERPAWLDGLAAGLAAWLFSGPLLVLAIATVTRLPAEPFWQMARVALVALPAAGLAIGAAARRTRLPK